MAPDDQLLDLAGAFVEAGDATIAPEAFGFIFVRETVAAVDLDRHIRIALGCLGGIIFGHRDRYGAHFALVLHIAGLVDQQPSGFGVHGHLCQHILY